MTVAIARRTIVASLAVLLLLAVAPAASAHDPTSGGSKGSFSSAEVIVYKWGPDLDQAGNQWIKDVYIDSLEDRWVSTSWNNSLAPTFSGPSSSGTAAMKYKALEESPCSGSPIWIQCARNWGADNLKIYVRNFDDAPYSNWSWWDKTGECTTSNCWFMRRTMIHEIAHAVLSLNHDEQGRLDTVMASTSPEYTVAGGQREVLQRCDQARAQMLWDLLSKYDRYGDCFDDITNGGTNGLKTAITVGPTAYYGCNGYPILVDGRLEVIDYSSYDKLGGNALAGRTVWFDRDSTPKYSSTTAIGGGAPATNWTGSFVGSNVTYTWTAHFDHVTDEDLSLGLNSSSTDQFTTAFSPFC